MFSASGRRCKVLYSYQPNNDDELQLEVNDIIEVLAEVEDGWWKGCLRNKVRTETIRQFDGGIFHLSSPSLSKNR